MWKVIAADDEGYIREALQKLINWERLGCQLAAVAGDGQELMERIKEELPDIVITDIQMPGADGIAVCKYLYEISPETPVIILTAHSDFEYARAAIRYDACEYVLKVSIMEELEVAVEKAIARLTRLHREVENGEDGGGESASLIERIDAYIQENYRNKITLDEMAEALHVNRSYLSRFYKSKREVNLFDAILQRRIEAAKDCLLHTDMKTYEISEAIGVEDAGYFSKMFKRSTGCSPKEYRKRGGK
ncbi:MAG: response regulator [Lachnospiraceae bacterium]|nr:response regulator [Lachnospiraceae bacterium]MDY5742694.1 response regulator [Lachnospiraceae bacterium]